MTTHAAQTNGDSHLDHSPDQGAQSSLKIIIVGAGIAGLTAAAGLRRQGHQVFIYEQSQLADEIGAAIHMSPNANGILTKLGIDITEKGATTLLQTRYFNSAYQLLSIDDNQAQSHRWQAKWQHAHRGHLHSQLKQAAVSAEYEGPPAHLHTASRIVDIDAQSARITLANGDVSEGDVIVGADGVRSICRNRVFGSDHDSFKIGKSAFRFMIHREDILADPVTRELGEAEGSMDLYFSEDVKIITYSCVYDTLINVVCIHPAQASDASAETYNKTVSLEQVLSVCQEFHPTILSLIKKCDTETLKVYPLFDASTLPTFVSDRLALIGDAAHPFTPFIGQGGATALEDAVSIGVLLSSSISRAEVPERLQLYNKARYERATRIQGYSRTAGGDGVKPGEEKAAKMKGREYAFYALSHDEFHASTQILREYEWSKMDKVSWRQPTVFGPTPGPRPDRRYRKRTTISIDFKTSGTLLRNLLPHASYSLASKDTVAPATIRVQSYRKVEWLGHRGFDRVILEIPGVHYERSNGSIVAGRYVPVMFENSADSLSVAREEQGYPSVFSDIEVDNSAENSVQVHLSQYDTRWATIWLKGPTKSSAEAMLNGPVFLNRYIPVVSNDQTRLDVVLEEEQPHGVTNGSVASNLAVLTFPQAGFERLAELPIMEVTSAMMWDEEGPEENLTVSKLTT